MNACPICEQELMSKSALVTHAWQHLPLDDEPSIKRKKATPAQCRVCWCGLRVYAFVFWLEHMAGTDVQAHYAASMLGIKA
jgi:hypothetical protein